MRRLDATRTQSTHRLLLAGLLFALSSSGASRAKGDGPLGPEGSAITTSNYAIDFSRGTVLSASRVTGLAGAFSAIAEGAEGGLTNPAAVAVRFPASADFWDYWLALGFTYPFENGDYYNDGDFLPEPEDASYFFLNPGAYLQLWNFGVGLDVDIQQISLERATGSGDDASKLHIQLQLIANHVQVGSLLLDGSLVIGGGLIILRERALGGEDEKNLDKLFVEVGIGGELGVLIRPNGKQWRVGAGLYSKVSASSGSGDEDVMAGSIYLPKEAVHPWRGSAAFAYQFGDRPFNPRFTYVDEQIREPVRAIERRMALAQVAHEQRMTEIRTARGEHMLQRLRAEEAAHESTQEALATEQEELEEAAWRHLRAQVRTGWSRKYVLLTTELSLTGRVDRAVGVSSFMAGTVQRSGERITVSPRAAVESEIWPQRMKVRGGLYLEPSRFRENGPRLHGTMGMDVRLFHWAVFGIWPDDYLWQLSVAFDVTVDYMALSTGIGGWY